MPVNAPNPKSRSMAYCSAGASRAANFTSAMLLENRIASARVSTGSGSSSVMVRPPRRYLPSSPDTRSAGATRWRASSAAAVKIFATEPGSKVSVKALGRAEPSRRPAAVVTHPADDGAGEVGRRIEPVEHGLEVYAAHCAERLHLDDAVGTSEIGVAPAQGALHVGRGEPQPARDAGDILRGVAQLVDSDADVIRLLGEGERRAVAVREGAPPRRERDMLGALRPRLLRPAAPLEQLQLRRTPGDAHQRAADHDFDRAQPHGELRHQRGSPGGSGSRIISESDGRRSPSRWARGTSTAAAGRCAFLVSTRPSARPRHVHTGWRGGHTHALLQSRNACFTMRSSPE